MGDKNMKTAGWVWEGLAFDPGVDPSIMGLGEGMKYFGLSKANFIFHPNNRYNIEKLSGAEEITADISKWQWYETKAVDGRFTFAQHRDDSPERVAKEAALLSELAVEFPNVKAAYIDDTHGVATHSDYTPSSPMKIKEAVCRRKADLDLWIVVYTHELENEYWNDWMDAIDVVTLWIWESRNLPQIDDSIDACRRRFPGKRINMGVYIRDYHIREPVPLDLMEGELQAIKKHLEAGTLDSYSILGTCLIDQQPEQAELIRRFIQAEG